jgi:DNA polymerase-4
MSYKDASVLYLTISDFASSVAQALDSSLVGKAFVIAKKHALRPFVLSSSFAARSEGIYRGMSVIHALHRCPSLIIVEPNPQACDRYDLALFEYASHYTPTLQASGGGDLYADMRGTTRLFGPPIDSASHLRRTIEKNLKVELSVAVATNKLVAHIGAHAVTPYGLTYIPPGEEASFLHSQDVQLLPGVGVRTQQLLHGAGFNTIGDVASLSDTECVAFLGKRGLTLRDAARGIDESIITNRPHALKDIHKRIDFFEPVFELEALEAALIQATEEAAFEMRKERLMCRRISLTLYWSDGVSSEEATSFSYGLYYDNDAKNIK